MFSVAFGQMAQPAEALHQCRVGTIWRTRQAQPAALGMGELEPDSRQQQAGAFQCRGEVAVVVALAVLGVADDRVATA